MGLDLDPGLIRKALPQLRPVFFAVGPGTSIQDAADQRAAAGSRQAAGATISAFVLFSWNLRNNPLHFALLPFVRAKRGLTFFEYRVV